MSATLELPAETEAFPFALDSVRESERLEDLRSLSLLDTPPEDRFDRITRLAAQFFHTPMAYVALIDSDRQWYKSRVGICGTETSRNVSFCQYTIHRNEPLIIPDTHLHSIGKNHPMVVGDPYVRFYAGVPLAGPRGQKIGSFCVADTKPRAFGEEDIERLTVFAAMVEREINLGQIIQAQNELLDTRHQLVEAQEKLHREFSDAAKYVRLMLPPPFSGEETVDWQFHPSTHLGGDGLGYRHINDDLFAFYVLDVTGHGLGSALLAVTALELLRNRAAQVDFSSPAAVIEQLNRTFQMKDHAGKFFSVWYGVYSRSAHTITYANAGHPPALLVTRKQGVLQLSKTAASNSVLGIFSEINASETTIEFPATSELCLFTDGLYELTDPQGGRGSYDEFLAYLETQTRDGKPAWDAILQWFHLARDKRVIDDDVTLLRFATKS